MGYFVSPDPFLPVSVLLIAKAADTVLDLPQNRITCKTLPQALSLQSCSCWNTQVSALLQCAVPGELAQISALPLNVGKRLELCLCEHAVHEGCCGLGVPAPPFSLTMSFNGGSRLLPVHTPGYGLDLT